jgi:hypothetical protein
VPVSTSQTRTQAEKTGGPLGGGTKNAGNVPPSDDRRPMLQDHGTSSQRGPSGSAEAPSHCLTQPSLQATKGRPQN